MFSQIQRLIGWGFILFFLWEPPALGTFAPEIDNRAEVRALYLYNLLLFVEWPDRLPLKDDPFCILVVGDDSMYEKIQRLDEKRVQGRKLMIRRWGEDRKIPPGCSVCYIGASKIDMAPQLLKKLKGEGILTVSEMEGFTEMGGMVQFKNISGETKPNSKRFKINLTAVKREGLKIRARVLRLADIVYGPE
ncbi:MAG: YfiR family protein [Desulfobacteraceae bacterium]